MTYRLTLLGTLDLLSPQGVAVGSVLAQPKRVGLLAYLALSPPRGFHRRDALLPLFWPELDEKHARGALSKAVHYLRASLGAETVPGRGAEELTVDPGRLWCDAAACHDALDEGRLEAALALYRGDLLPGFYVDEAPAFEEWLSRERGRLRARVAQAAGALAEAAAAAGSTDDAARWARRAAELAPEDEALLRLCMAILDRAGDRAGALGVYEAFAARLRAELDVDPAPETRAQAAAIRLRDHVPAPLGSTRPAEEPSPAGAMQPPSVPAAVEAAVAAPIPAPRPRLRAGGLVAALAAALAGAWLAARTPAAAPAPGASVETVAVLPFVVEGGADAAYLEEGMVDLLSGALGQDGRLRPVSPERVLRAAGRDGVGDPEQARVLAGQAGARFAVVGAVTVRAGQVELVARLFDREPGTVAVAETRAAGAAERLPELAGELARGLSQARGRVPASPRGAFASVSLPAMQAYMEGERASRAGRFAAATAAYQRAIAADSGFAFAYYRLSVASSWSGAELTAWAANQAVRRIHLLGPEDSLRVEAWQAYLGASPLRAERLYHELLARAPSDPGSWFYLGETLFHWGRWWAAASPKHGWPSSAPPRWSTPARCCTSRASRPPRGGAEAWTRWPRGCCGWSRNPPPAWR